MKRRDFLRNAIITAAAVALSDKTPVLAQATNTLRPVDLAVAKGDSPEKTVRAAVNALGGMGRFIAKNDIVVIKPNMAWDRTPEQAGNTNPEVVAGAVRMCFEAGAKKVKVFDRSVNDPRRCYVQSGIAAAARAAGAETPYMDDRKFKEMNINGRSLKSWPLYSEIFEADKVINIPIAKHHGLARLTLSMKNWMGIMGGRRSHIHQNLDESLADLAKFVKPALTILDAVRILKANGPQGGSLDDVEKLDTVIAGTDPVAVDSFGATLFGMQGKDLGYVRFGHEIGLGVMDLDSLNISRIKA